MTTMTHRRVRGAALLAVAALGLSACGAVEDLTGGSDNTSRTDGSQQPDGDGGSTDGGSADGGSTDGGTTDDGSTDGGSTDGGSTDEGTTDEGATDDGSSDGGSTSLTPPGTQLKVGETATIPQGKDDVPVTMTVSSITKGSYADLSQLKNADKYAGYTPYYVNYTMTGTDASKKLGYHMLEYVRPVLPDGRTAGSLVVIGKFDKCDGDSMPKDFGPGQTSTDCDIAMLPDGQELGGVEFEPYDGPYEDSGKVMWTQ